MKLHSFLLCCGFVLCGLVPINSLAQVLAPDGDTNYYLIHASGKIVSENTEERAVIQDLSGGEEQLLQFVSDGEGYYWVKLAGQDKYMALSGGWNTYFVTDSTTSESRYAIEKVSNSFIRLKCKSNNKYLGTDDIISGSSIYSDKDGLDTKHYWYISEDYKEAPVDTFRYLINPNAGFTESFEGWGVSLCWWANMCGKWTDDDKIDELVDWLVSPEGLNYNIFRYNIGGGDDPLNRHCTPHHMADGKGIRAEMEGFKDSLDADYNWSRDAGQRKIMLKIKEKRPDAIFEAFSNSAPYYMTYSGCCAGNVSAWDDNLKPEYYEEFAHYLVDVCQFYKDSFDIEFKTLEPFNEPVTNYWGANGGQEGCHFSTSAQIDFLKVLAPILRASELTTIIAASDETSTAQSVIDFKAYVADGSVLDLVGQWNTHTYGASNKDRANLRALATAHDKMLWMSEVGSGGSGISGNLNVAKKLMDDIRYIRPEAWVDWQYVEEENDQWCFVRGNFSEESYNRVKNYYVRQQFSRYIPVGSRFLSVPNDQMLAALSPLGDELTIVLLNNSTLKVNHEIDLSLFDQLGSDVTATRTSGDEDNVIISDYALTGSSLSILLPPQSVTTLVLPIAMTLSNDDELQTGVPYLLLSRVASLVMQSSDDKVGINNYRYGDSTQLWHLSMSGSAYTIKNLAGRALTDVGDYYCVASSGEEESGQVFELESVGDDFFKVLSSSTGKVLDLEDESNAVGTRVGLSAYGVSPAVSYRQWMFVLPPFNNTEDIPSGNDDFSSSVINNIRIVGVDGAIEVFQTPDSPSIVTVYSISGVCLLQQKVEGAFAHISMPTGLYVVTHQKGSAEQLTPTKVLVK